MEIMMTATKRYYFASIYPNGQKQRQLVTYVPLVLSYWPLTVWGK